MIPRAVGIILISLCTACAVSRPEITHLQLRSLATTPGTGDTPVIILDAVNLPDYLLRDELMRRRGDYRVYYDPAFRWAEPLDLGIQRVLARTLESELDTRHIVRFPAMPRGTAGWLLDVQILSFEAIDDRVVLQAEGVWSTGAAPERTLAAVDFEDSRPLAGTAAAETLAAALSELLDAFSRELALALRDVESL